MTGQEIRDLMVLEREATSGEWEVEEHRPGDWRIDIPDGEGGCWWIAEVHAGDNKAEEANAKLIAALRNHAPELLAAVELAARAEEMAEAFRGGVCKTPKCCKAGRAVLAKFDALVAEQKRNA